jgi:hypothetical protein
MSHLPLYMPTLLTAVAHAAVELCNRRAESETERQAAVWQSVLEEFNTQDPQYVPPPRLVHQPYTPFWQWCLQMGNAQFKKQYRMTRINFDRLHNMLFGEELRILGVYNSHLYLAVFLYRMATKETCRELSNVFGVGKNTVCYITRTMVRLMKEKLDPIYLRFPSTRGEFMLIAEEWEKNHGFPNIIGVVQWTAVVSIW